jgi:hypothetical protein
LPGGTGAQLGRSPEPATQPAATRETFARRVTVPGKSPAPSSPGDFPGSSTPYRSPGRGRVVGLTRRILTLESWLYNIDGAREQ